MIGRARGLRFSMVAAFMAFVMFSSGCSPKATAEPTATPERPQVTAAPEKVAAPAVERFVGYTVKVKPARGPEMKLTEPIAAQLVMDAFSSQRLQVEDAVGRFENKLEVVNPQGEAEYAFTFSSDGQMLMQFKDGRVFRMPEYIYFLLEENLWTYGGSVVKEPLEWEPDEGTAVLELELPRLLKTSMFPAFGYAEAYFVSYKIYGVNTSTRNVAKVYLLLTYAGYEIDKSFFTPLFMYTTPVTAIFELKAKVWELTALKQPLKSDGSKADLYTKVRDIFLYDYMEDVMDDLKDPSEQILDIVRQATEYLNDVGIAGTTVES